MNNLKSIKRQELPILAEAVMDENELDVVKSSRDIHKIDLMLSVMRNKSLLNSYGKFTKKGRLRKIKTLDKVIEKILES